MTADIVIVVHNSGDVVLRCLELLRPQAEGHSVYVVDNGSSDDSVAQVRRLHPWANVIEMGFNAGFSAGNNAGAAAGSGDVIVALNDDVWVEPGFVAAMLAPFGSERVGMVAGLTLRPGGELVDAFGIELDATLTAYNRLTGRPPGNAGGVIAAPNGAAAAYRRAAYEQAGGFDEAFFSYGEDLDLGLRIAEQGWDLAAAPAARAVHLGGASWNKAPAEKLQRAGFGRGLVLRRYGALRTRAAPRIVLVELLTAAYNLAARRSAAPLRARVAGWRAAGPGRHRYPRERIERSIGVREQLRRMRG